jgi:hypothetical protein
MQPYTQEESVGLPSVCAHVFLRFPAHLRIGHIAYSSLRLADSLLLSQTACPYQ